MYTFTIVSYSVMKDNCFMNETFEKINRVLYLNVC